MKRLVALILTAAMIVSCFSMTAFAKDIDKKVKLSISIDTSNITVGTDPDSLCNRSDFPIISITQAPNKTSEYVWRGDNNLRVDYESVEVISPSKTLKVGDKVKVEMVVSVSGSYVSGDNVYYWVPGDSKSVTIHRGGDEGPTIDSTSSKKSGETYTITFTTKAVKGTYDEPEDLRWTSSANLGQARWSKPESGNSAGVYDLRLRRDGKLVCEFSLVSGNSMNFYPWMTKEGDYTFEVRSTVPADVSGARRSDWAESDSQYVSANRVSDGSGQYDPSGTGTGGGAGNTTQVGWVKSGNTWYYRYPDGAYKKNGWEKIAGKWYYFDGSGAMKTGWVTVNNQTYYLDSTNGDMKTGWVKTADGQWYFLNPPGNSYTEGAMYKDQWLNINGRTYYFKSTGAMATGWLKIGDKYYYFNPASGSEEGAMLRNTRIDSFYVGADGAWVQGA